MPGEQSAPLESGFAEVAKADVLKVHQLHDGMPASECCCETRRHHNGTRQQEQKD